MNRQRKFAIAGVTGAMLVGAGTGVVLNLPAGAGASDSATIATSGTTDSTDTTDTTVATESGSTDTTTATTDGTAPTPPDAPEIGRGDFLKTALDALVADGTITQAQEDAILAGLKAQMPTVGDGKFPGMGGMPGRDGMGGPDMGRGGMGHGPFGGPGIGGRGAGLDAAATALGITTDELQTELQDGKTIADVATEKGVDVQKVIDAIVAAETANITERVTDMVNGVRPEKPADPSTDSSTTTPTTGG